MLPDVGMVKMYPKCPEAGMNVDLGCYNVIKYIHFLVPEVIYWLIFNAIATTYVSETQCTIPTSLLLL